MNFKIFQVKRNLVGSHTHNFSDLRASGVAIELKNYDQVYEGKSDLTDRFDVLQDLFDVFNIRQPKDFFGRSMSVSDIVQLDDRYYFCDSIGWQEVEPAETNEQIIARIEKTLDTFGEIYYMDREYWTGGQIRDMQDAEEDLKWLIERAKRADLLEREFQGIAESAYELKQELDRTVEEDS